MVTFFYTHNLFLDNFLTSDPLLQRFPVNTSLSENITPAGFDMILYFQPRDHGQFLTETVASSSLFLHANVGPEFWRNTPAPHLVCQSLS